MYYTYLKDSGDGAAGRLLVPVERQADGDAERAGEHHESSEREAEVPSDVVLHPHQEDDPNHRSQRYADLEPVEEADLAGKLRRGVLVELVAAQRRRARAQRALAERDQI